jgi:hypothetical protein
MLYMPGLLDACSIRSETPPTLRAISREASPCCTLGEAMVSEMSLMNAIVSTTG